MKKYDDFESASKLLDETSPALTAEMMRDGFARQAEIDKARKLEDLAYFVHPRDAEAMEKFLRKYGLK